jgi:colicin import membrane protein
MSMSAENSVVSSLNELMRLEADRVREEEAVRQENARRTREEEAIREENARRTRQGEAVREENARRGREAEARVVARIEPAPVPPLPSPPRVEVLVAPVAANVDERVAPLRRQLRRARVALAATLLAWAGSLAATIAVLRSAAAEDERELVARFDAAGDASARTRAALERRVAESDERLLQIMADLEDARRRQAAPVVAPVGEDARPKPAEGRVTPRGAARRNPTCDPHDPLCGDLP